MTTITEIDLVNDFKTCGEYLESFFPRLALVKNRDRGEERRIDFSSGGVQISNEQVVDAIDAFAKEKGLRVKIGRNYIVILKDSEEVGVITITNYTGSVNGTLIISFNNLLR